MAEPRAQWTPPSSLEEHIKRFFIPPPLEVARIAHREMRKGEPEIRLLPILVDPRRAAIDAGANRGVWAYHLARLAPKVYAYEPNPKLFPILKAGARRNVACFAYGLSDEDGGADLMVPGQDGRYSNQGATLNPAKVDGVPFATTRVETHRLDSLALDPVGFIKIDVEGHELAVLRGARALIARDRPRMVIEIEARHMKLPLADALSEIAAMGYRMMYLAADGLRDGGDFDAANQTIVPGPRGPGVNNFIFLPV